MADRITVTAADGHRFEAWRADAPEDAAGGIVLLHAIYGLTPHIGDVCDWFARDGFTAIAPALYDRAEKGTVFAYDPGGVARGMMFRENLEEETVLADVAAAAAELRESVARVAVSGFCTGGTWAWIASCSLDLDAGVIFYGSDIRENIARTPRCPVMLHYGDADRIVPFEDVEAIRDAHPSTDFHVYPGCDHAFYNPEQGTHDAPAAALAHARSLEFLYRRLASGPGPG